MDDPLDEMRPTARQEAVLAVLQAAPGPLTAAEALERAGTVIPGLGIATVYRALKRLHDAGTIRAVDLPGDAVRYEPSAREHHHHFHCRLCDGVFDVDLCPLPDLPSGPFSGGYQLEDHDLTLYGICPDCAPSPAAVG